MITLRADNRVLVNNAKFAYLVENYQSGAPLVIVTNSEPFEVGTPILLSEMGQTDAEVLKVKTLTISTNTIILGDVDDNAAVETAFSHPESTRVVALPYDQIRFFWTPATNTIADENPVFDDSTPLTDWVDLDPSSYYSTFGDPDHASGFGWFMYQNATTSETSTPSNPIPYVGFNLNTVQQVFADFESLLNTNELKLVSTMEKFAWLNEALAMLKNKLNLTNVEYTVSVPQYLSVISGTAEYILPSDFSDVVEITDAAGKTIPFIPVSQVLSNVNRSPSEVSYYLRGRYLGFTPAPTTTAASAYIYTYRALASRVSSLSTYLDLPDNAFYSLKDWMMFRACSKFNNPMAQNYYGYFKNSVDLFMQSAVKRNANLDTWGIVDSANT